MRLVAAILAISSSAVLGSLPTGNRSTQHGDEVEGSSPTGQGKIFTPHVEAGDWRRVLTAGFCFYWYVCRMVWYAVETAKGREDEAISTIRHKWVAYLAALF